MLSFITVFFFIIYIICEMCKFRVIETLKDKKNNRVYNKPVVVVKLISLIIIFILVIINRFTKGGIIERSGGIKPLIMYLVVMSFLIFFSIRDLKKATKETIYNE